MRTSLQEIESLSDRVTVSIFYGADYTSYHRPPKWDVQLKFKDGSTKLELSHKGANLEEAIEEAWRKLRRIISDGMPNGALEPPVEGRVLVQQSSPDDEIPF